MAPQAWAPAPPLRTDLSRPDLDSDLMNAGPANEVSDVNQGDVESGDADLSLSRARFERERSVRVMGGEE